MALVFATPAGRVALGAWLALATAAGAAAQPAAADIAVNGITAGQCTGGLECRPPKPPTDDARDPFQATFYVGAAIDNFAPASVGGHTTTPGGYLNPEKGGTSSTRTVAGIDFEFRAVGDQQSARQLWLVGGTVHGVRSGDVDCTAAPNDRPPVCQTLGTRFGLQNPSAAFLYALEHATSFEAYLIPRWEFATLQPGTIFPSRAYVSLRMGVDMLSSDAHEAADFYHLDVGELFK